MKHLDQIKQRIRNMPKAEPPSCWQQKAYFAVGGLRAIGFDRSSDSLLVVSSQSRSVIDCKLGRKIAHDDSEYYNGEERLEAKGIGPLRGKIINMAGIHGGGLPLTTSNGWCLELVTIDWPIHELLLIEPGSSLYGSIHSKPDNFIKIFRESELRAFGFSHTGKSLVIASTHGLVIYGQD
jgi:hypothetical protein